MVLRVLKIISNASRSTASIHASGVNGVHNAWNVCQIVPHFMPDLGRVYHSRGIKRQVDAAVMVFLAKSRVSVVVVLEVLLCVKSGLLGG